MRDTRCNTAAHNLRRGSRVCRRARVRGPHGPYPPVPGCGIIDRDDTKRRLLHRSALVAPVDGAYLPPVDADQEGRS
jgi:hypothetical protein